MKKVLLLMGVMLSLSVPMRSQQSVDIVDCWSRATELIVAHQFSQAREWLQRGLPVAVGSVHRKFLQRMALSYYMEASLMRLDGGHDTSYPLFVEAEKYYRQAGDSASLLKTLDQMAELQQLCFSSARALSIYGEMVSMAFSLKDTLSVVRGLRQMRTIYREQDRWDRALALSMQMDSLYAGLSDVTARIEWNTDRGDEALRLGKRYAVAESFYRKNFQLIPLLPAEKQYQQLHALNLRLSELFRRQKKLEEALRYKLAANDCYEKEYVQARSTYERYLPYDDLAFLYGDMKNRTEAYRCMDSLFCTHCYPEVSSQTKASHYFHRGLIRRGFAEYAAAAADFQTADSLLALELPENDGSRMLLLLTQCGCLGYQNQWEEAVRGYRRYADWCRENEGEQSLDYAEALGFLANAEGFCGEKESGCGHYRQAAALLQRQLKKGWHYVTSETRAGYWEQMSSLLDNMVAYAVEIGARQEAFTREAYNALLFSKGLLLLSEKEMGRQLQQNAPEEVREKYRRLMQLKGQLLEVEGQRQRKEDITLLSQQIGTLDKQLTHYYSEKAVDTLWNVTYGQVCSHLKPGEVVVDFADYQGKSAHRYVAYVYRADWEQPLLVPLFQEAQLDSLSGKGAQQPDRIYSWPISSSVLQLCWQPLEAYVKPRETVYYVPSGVLHTVALESLAVSPDSLLGDLYRFSRLSSARELVEAKKTTAATTPQKTILYGGLQYDMEAGTMAMESRKYSLPQLYAYQDDWTRGTDSVYRPLPRSREEVSEIADLLRHRQLAVELRTDAQGTEESFLSMDGKAPQILHLATHGYCYTPAEAQRVKSFTGYEDAMLLSGLVLSGGNAAWRGTALPQGVLDGRMTADEISRLDLHGLDLVVLSACKSGRGEVSADGVYGLQRAFKKAGAQTVLMTLWEVSDRVSEEFMSQFYTLLVEENWNKQAAFNRAKAAIRQRYPHPYYWAGYVLLDAVKK